MLAQRAKTTSAHQLQLAPEDTWKHSHRYFEKGGSMLRWAIAFFLFALIAAVFGFGGIAAEATEIGKILAIIFLILFVVSLVVGQRRTLP